MKQFSKDDLVNGMVVETKDKSKYMVLGHKIIANNRWISLDGYNENLTKHHVKNESSDMSIYDIMKVYENDGCAGIDHFFDNKYLKLIWQRPKPILDDVEKEYLRGVIKPFRKRVSYIVKSKSCIDYRFFGVISIKVKGVDNDNIGEMYLVLPYFKIDTMYKGMEENKEYTLEELGL